MGKINENDIIGKQFGRLTVLELDHITKYKRPNGKVQNQYYYKCRCSCPNKTVVIVNRFDLTRKTRPTRSCGCINIEKVKESNTIHGDSGTRFYHIWLSMIQRCHNPNDTNYSRYGALGVSVCDRWRETPPNGYLNFKQDMHDLYLEHCRVYGEYNTSIDRINPYGNYCPENCRWATTSGQNSNKRETEYYIFNNNQYTKKELYDNFVCNLSWSGFCNRLKKLDSNIIDNPDIFYIFEQPIRNIDLIDNPIYRERLSQKIEKDKDRSKAQLIAMRDGVEYIDPEKPAEWLNDLPKYENENDLEQAKYLAKLSLQKMMNN